MLDNTISITDNGDTISLNRINQDGYTGNFFGRNADGSSDYTLEVKHSFPKNPGSGVEQHLVKLTKNDYASFDGKVQVVGTYSVHKVLKQLTGTQSNVDSLALDNAFDGLMTDAFVTKILDRRS